MSLTILGASHDQAALYFTTTHPDPTYITPDELATLRRRAATFGHANHEGHRLDETDIDQLIVAFNDPQPLWPQEECRWCETDATHLIEGDPHCNGHAAGYALREAGL